MTINFKKFTEALKGGQKKLDVNKNGKLEADDFKKLRKEEVELHPDAQKVLKHIKPEHHAKYTPDLTKKHYTGSYADRSAVLTAAEKAGHLKEEAELDEAIDAEHYRATSEPSQFGGHRPKVVHKGKGTTMHLGQQGYKTKEAAKAGAAAYLDAYEKIGDRAASRAAAAHAKNHPDAIKEETLDELNKDTIISYAAKSEKDLDKKHKELGTQIKANKPIAANKTAAKIGNRQAGLDRAEDRLNKEELELDEADKISTAQMGHAGKTTIKHIKNPTVQQRMAAHDVVSYKDRIDLLKAAKAQGNLKENSKLSYSMLIQALAEAKKQKDDEMEDMMDAEGEQGEQKISKRADTKPDSLGRKRKQAFKVHDGDSDGERLGEEVIEIEGGIRHKGTYGSEYETDRNGEEKKKAVVSAEKRGRGRPKKGSDSSGEVKKYTFNTLLNRLSTPSK